MNEIREEEMRASEARYLADLALAQERKGPTAEEIELMNKEFAKDARARLFWIYKTKNMKELKVFVNT